jgi:hypothetical protein
VFPLMVLLRTVTVPVPKLKTPPPNWAALPLTTSLFSVRFALLLFEMPPPLEAVLPFEIVRPEIVTPPEFSVTLKMRNCEAALR